MLAMEHGQGGGAGEVEVGVRKKGDMSGSEDTIIAGELGPPGVVVIERLGVGAELVLVGW